jgi:hypothetical protein
MQDLQLPRLNPRVARGLLWTGPVVFAIGMVCFIAIMRFIPPHDPTATAGQIATSYAEHKDRIRIGCFLLIIGWSLWCTWGAVIATMIRKTESRLPVLTYASLALIGAGGVVFYLIPVAWVLAAFRPETTDPSVIQMLNDAGWFLVLYTWPPFALWCVVIAIAIFADKNEPAVYPRWVAYLNIWVAVLLIPAGLIGFFKTGPFAYNGLFAFYLPWCVFFGWMIAMTVATFKAITREASEHPAPTPAQQPALERA